MHARIYYVCLKVHVRIELRNYKRLMLMFTSIDLKFSIDHLTKKQSRQSKEKKPNSPCAECLSRRQRPLLASLKKTYSWVIWSTIALYTSQHTSRMFRFPEFRLTLFHLSILPPLDSSKQASSHWSIYIGIWRETSGQDQNKIANRWSNFGSDILRYPRTSMLLF